jgi:2,4-dichlorophenol 6-monooxygenase
VRIATIDSQPLHGKEVLLIDHNDRWLEVNQLHPGGAVLVRPDNMVGWRSTGPSKAEGTELLTALEAIVGKAPKSNGELLCNATDRITAAASTRLQFVPGTVAY